MEGGLTYQQDSGSTNFHLVADPGRLTARDRADDRAGLRKIVQLRIPEGPPRHALTGIEVNELAGRVVVTEPRTPGNAPPTIPGSDGRIRRTVLSADCGCVNPNICDHPKRG